MSKSRKPRRRKGPTKPKSSPQKPKEPQKITRELSELERLACELVQVRTQLANSREELKKAVVSRYKEEARLREALTNMELKLLTQEVNEHNAKNLELAKAHKLPDSFEFKKDSVTGKCSIVYERSAPVGNDVVPPAGDLPSPPVSDDSADDESEGAEDEGDEIDESSEGIEVDRQEAAATP